jgi:hypothetical protein
MSGIAPAVLRFRPRDVSYPTWWRRAGRAAATAVVDPNLTKAIAALAHLEHVRLRSSHQAEAHKPWPKNGISVTFDTRSAPYNRM